jgi:outer membrane lipoprotein-sorting protein
MKKLAGIAAARLWAVIVGLVFVGPVFVSLAVVGPAHADDTASADATWAAIGEFRSNLESQSPLGSSFVQTYLPEGFSSGDSERGVLLISLPDCLRWDYSDPFPKSFLLCEDTAWYWNPGETVGQRYGVDRQTPGLDFFLLPTETLRDRYSASSSKNPDGSLSVTLIPNQPSDDVVSATLLLTANDRRLDALSYTDIEGNRTHFEMSDYRTRQTFETALFAPPNEVEWQDPD